MFFFFSSRRRHTRSDRDWSSDVCSSDLFKDNAGGIEFYEDSVVTLKGETHNFPSSIAPFGGVATKHGGVIRDTLGFGKGAYPIGGATSLGTMGPRHPQDKRPPGGLHPPPHLGQAIQATP